MKTAAMKTAAERITQAIADGVAVALDRETRAFACFRFQLTGEQIATAVRVHRASPEFQALAAVAA
jgi:hypothetical protein